MIYHLFTRTQLIKGKKVKTWYYWFKDEETGKQIRKSCGKNGKPCFTKKDALIFLEELKNQEFEKKEKKIIFNDFCEDFFERDSLHIRRLELKNGIVFNEKTLLSKKVLLKHFLLNFGNTEVDKVSITDIDNWLIQLPYSVSYKNHLLGVLSEVFRELYRDGLIQTIPLLERFKTKNTRKKGSLSIEEIKKLFPDNNAEIIEIWTLKKDRDYDTFQFATIIFFMLATGVRSGELRAIKKDQIINGNCLLLSHMIDSSTNRVDHLKKGNDFDKKWRVTIIPQRVLKMLEDLEKHYNYPKQTDFLFEIKGEPIKRDYITKRLQKTLLKNGIDYKSRNITAHSLRYTYNTIMRKEISENDLRMMIGHTNERMTDHYDTSTALDNIDAIKKNENVLNKIWS